MLSEYEALREARIAENKAMLASLGIAKMSEAPIDRPRKRAATDKPTPLAHQYRLVAQRQSKAQTTTAKKRQRATLELQSWNALHLRDRFLGKELGRGATVDGVKDLLKQANAGALESTSSLVFPDATALFASVDDDAPHGVFRTFNGAKDFSLSWTTTNAAALNHRLSSTVRAGSRDEGVLPLHLFVSLETDHVVYAGRLALLTRPGKMEANGTRAFIFQLVDEKQLPDATRSTLLEACPIADSKDLWRVSRAVQ
ncbi:hypothetical protein SPRG_02139 [Saprolegnia parasitica CBS 223.65]|uniref:Uncharacterized protein n=1 Tax=Saprolegnia parasitica (strain CBS 223.65) TaxID=695850 RepID=A0A067D3M4_SAPPC|nr:hypothetical protein SPRG_02139 [Saprolegnia parasitica CBS 223.65]KDO33331.1 hypothetical protein SPRG_02139 [Saprolegnia parasitica CBS 223.65]|eukprot:XP_012196080.1 hypothetical protein SPRG_02139 [Saprolegnia parasitica CBS 223.65]